MIGISVRRIKIVEMAQKVCIMDLVAAIRTVSEEGFYEIVSRKTATSRHRL